MEGDEEALKILLNYNEADTKNLYQLAEVLYMMLSREYGPENIDGEVGRRAECVL